MNAPVSHHPSTTRLQPPRGDGREGALPPASLPTELFSLMVRELHAITVLRVTQREALDHALNMCGQQRADALRLALAIVRANSNQIAAHCLAMENAIMDHESSAIDTATTVYEG